MTLVGRGAVSGYMKFATIDIGIIGITPCLSTGGNGFLGIGEVFGTKVSFNISIAYVRFFWLR